MTTKTTIERQLVSKIKRTPEHILLDNLLAGQEGEGWYDRARDNIDSFARAIDVPRLVVCDVMAILSPRCSVSRCDKMTAEHFLNSRRRPEGSMLQRWESILSYYRHGNVGSHKALKIRAFARALSGDKNSVVCDTHIAAMFGVDYGKNGLPEKAYNTAVDRIVRVADRFSLPPADAQAMLWVGHRINTGQQREGDHVADVDLLAHLPLSLEIC